MMLKSGGRSFTLKSRDSRLNWESWNLCNQVIMLSSGDITQWSDTVTWGDLHHRSDLHHP